ncbi:MAG TPA: hypothetical protein PKJ33_01885 [Alphaproteobacteria bacterium]|nr:hypothetical protein [Alphaproteobacteria bacterium]
MNYDLSNLKVLSTVGTSGVIVYEYEDDKVILYLPGNQDVESWLLGQILAQNITNQLIDIKNKTYSVPKILKILKSDRIIIESRLFGEPLTKKLFCSLDESDKYIVQKGIANLINDMNQMRPVKEPKYLLNNAGFSFEDILKKLSEILPNKTIKHIENAYKKFIQLNGSSIVFSHTDLYNNNILWNSKTKTVGILDFAESDFKNINEIIEKLSDFDSNKILDIYTNLPKNQPVYFEQNKTFTNLFKMLRDFYLVANAYFKNQNSGLLKTLLNNTGNLSNYLNITKGSEILKKSFNSTPVIEQSNQY